MPLTVSLRSLASGLLVAAALFATPCTRAGPEPRALDAALHDAAPDVPEAALNAALDALDCAAASGELQNASRLALIDYSLPSLQPRLWVFDLGTRRLLFREHVAHGRNSGENLTQHFSNEDGSHRTSLGLFRTDSSYVGANGYSLRLVGLDAGFNDRAMSRAIVMHGAPYVDARLAKKQGRLGRSWGCPAVRAAVAKPMIDSLKNGQLLFSYYPDQKWLTSSRYLNCASASRGRPQLALAAR